MRRPIGGTATNLVVAQLFGFLAQLLMPKIIDFGSAQVSSMFESFQRKDKEKDHPFLSQSLEEFKESY